MSPNTDSPNAKQWNTSIEPFAIRQLAPENLHRKYNGTTLDSITERQCIVHGDPKLFTKRVLM